MGTTKVTESSLNPETFTEEREIKHHRGANLEIMLIIKSQMEHLKTQKFLGSAKKTIVKPESAEFFKQNIFSDKLGAAKTRRRR